MCKYSLNEHRVIVFVFVCTRFGLSEIWSLILKIGNCLSLTNAEFVDVLNYATLIDFKSLTSAELVAVIGEFLIYATICVYKRVYIVIIRL